VSGDRKISIVIIDDDHLAAGALRTIISCDGRFSVEGTGQSEKEAIDLFLTKRPDLMLLDIRLGDGGSGLHAAGRILQKDPGAKVIFLSTFLDPAYLREAVALGARGYLLKQYVDALIPALIAVDSGQRVFADAVAEQLPVLLAGKDLDLRAKLSAGGLSDREIDVVLLVADGKNNKEIASELYLSEGTVRNTISLILDKLDLRDRTQLAIYCYRGPDS
jgi:DNA-binding NarL/FixJ family response regulator